MVFAKLSIFGLPIAKDDVELILNFQESCTESRCTELDAKLKSLRYFFKFDNKFLNKEILERYLDCSDQNMYIPIIPHEDKLHEYIFDPYASAKRCYCLGEYLAAIELSAHVAEMLTTLVDLISKTSINGKKITKKIEEFLYGSKFEKLGQERRLKVLKAFNKITENIYEDFMQIKTIRAKYFHLWGHERGSLKDDSLKCFKLLTMSMKEVMEIKPNNNPPPEYLINNNLKEYLERLN